MRNLDELFAALAQSRFRSRFHLGPQEQAYVSQRGREVVEAHARDLIAQRLAPGEIPNDGKQTPMRGHPVFIAQHATATCCRGCLAKWPVWDHLHGRDCSARPADIDLVHFSQTLPRAADARLQVQLAASTPGQVWDVTNQAHVHTWYGAGRADVPQLLPLCSTLHGISMWPETATAVGVRLEADDALTLAAPLGLEDLFALRLCWNPRLVSRDIFRRRVGEKHFLARWPRLTLVE